MLTYFLQIKLKRIAVSRFVSNWKRPSKANLHLFGNWSIMFWKTGS